MERFARIPGIPHRSFAPCVRWSFSLVPVLIALVVAAPLMTRTAAAQDAETLARQVEIRRTAYGVPHIRAENLRAAGFGLAYVQLEDYGERIPHGLLRARGELARHFGRDSIDADVYNRRTYRRAVETYAKLDADTRAVMEGFAAGVNYYVELHPDEFADWVRPMFTPYDVAARDIRSPSARTARRFLERLEDAPEEPPIVTDGNEGEPHPDVGSNAWAFAPSRMESGNAVLVRNPHLSWTSGYYEAQMTVPGEFNFYGDFRIGGPFGIIGGFNEHLGWSTTNNGPDTDEIYALDVDPERPNHYLFDGASVPLQREEITIQFRNGDGLGSETREYWTTPLGPVIHRGHGKIYVIRAAGDGEFRVGQQFLRMMQARSLEEWKDAMRMRARTASNFTYADRDGNIFYVWNATIPDLPHRSGGDTLAIPASRTADVWTRPIPFDSLPQVLNPASGYLHNENDPFHYANLDESLDPADFPDYYPEPRLRLRSQHSLELIHNNDRLTLEEIVRRKHSMRMLLADRVKQDLVAAVRASDPEPEVAEAIDLIEGWDNTVARDSRGGVLFKTWWWRYVETADSARASSASVGFRAEADDLFEQPWTPEAPMATPHGLADAERAADAFARAVDEAEDRYGAWDVAWGDVHRARLGDEVDLPVGGCTGMLGCFRVLWYTEDDDGKLRVRGGDGWVFAVEFGETPRAYTILAYGQSAKEGSPHFADQVEMFTDNRMKPIAFTASQIRDGLLRSYHPGEEADRPRADGR